MENMEKDLKEKGWAIIPGFFSESLMNEINGLLPYAVDKRKKIMEANGLVANTQGTAHHVMSDGNCFVEILEKFSAIDELLTSYFGGKYILNSYGGFINEKSANTYSKNMHRDVRTYTGDLKMMINLLVMLDDFTLENGATYLLSHSHLKGDRPEEDFFYEHAERAIGKKGDLLIFDSHVWHATGNNTTDHVRRALTITLTRPYYKQQADYPRIWGYDKMDMQSEYLNQIIGYYSRVPATLEDYFQPVEKRFYRRNQE
jgi:ectoine hydroxylase-related dioxygenase (phytanoyl-CoA dioxygenase family)